VGLPIDSVRAHRSSRTIHGGCCVFRTARRSHHIWHFAITRSVTGQLPLGVFVSGFCALPQFTGKAAPGQPAGQLPPRIIISEVGEHAHHIHVAQPGPPACQELSGPALLSTDQLA
jgi:hypothetical protein